MTVKSIQIVTNMEFEVLAKYCKSPLESSIKKKQNIVKALLNQVLRKNR